MSTIQIQINKKYEQIVPPLTKSEYEQLKSSIKTDGLYIPIIINQNNILLDGHHRFKICSDLGIAIRYNVKEFDNELLEEKFVIESNLRRRQLNDFQKAELGIPLQKINLEIAKQIPKGRGKTSPNGEHFHSNKETSKNIGVSSRTFERAKKIIESNDEKLKESVRSGKTSISYAYSKINRLDKKKNAKPLPQGEFNVILADPPWEYDIDIRGSPSVHYDVMTIEDICNMKIPAADDCILFLWATAPKLPEAIHVLESWGFDYKTHMVWIKDKIGTGFYFRGQHELLLVGKKGQMLIPEEEDRPSSVLESPRTKHSKKPEEIYPIIEKMYPGCKFLELFARKEKQGWNSWGDEID